MIEMKMADESLKQKLGAEFDVYVLYNGNEIMGWSEFEATSPNGIIHKIECDDALLVDGLLRQTMFYMAQKMCLIAELDKDLAAKLQNFHFIKENEIEIKISEFFSKGCH